MINPKDYKYFVRFFKKFILNVIARHSLLCLSSFHPSKKMSEGHMPNVIDPNFSNQMMAWHHSLMEWEARLQAWEVSLAKREQNFQYHSGFSRGRGRGGYRGRGRGGGRGRGNYNNRYRESSSDHGYHEHPNPNLSDFIPAGDEHEYSEAGEVEDVIERSFHDDSDPTPSEAVNNNS